MADISKPRDLDAMMAERRIRSSPVRDLTDGIRREAQNERVFMTPAGWLVAVGCQVALVIAVVIGFLAFPSLLACHDREQRGFFVGDTFTSCATRGISARMGQFDQQIRQLILGSGR